MQTFKRAIPLLIILCLVIVGVCRLAIVDFYNSSFNGADSYVVYGVQRLLRGEPLYQNPEAPPYAIIQYSPLFYFLAAGCCKIFAIAATEVQSVFRVCRGLNLLENIGTLLFVWLIIRNTSPLKKNRWIYATPALLALTYHYYTRTDSLALMFFAAFMAALTLHAGKGSRRALLGAAIALVLCIFSKQSGVLCVLIAGWYLFFERRNLRETGLFSLAAIATTGVVYALFIAPEASVFYENAYNGLKNGYSLDFLKEAFIGQRYRDFVPLYLLAFMMLRWLPASKENHQPYRILVIGAALSWAFAIITGFKIGSAANYFTEFIVLVCAAIPGFQSLLAGKTFPLAGKPFRYAGFAGLAFAILVISKTTGALSATFIERYLENRPEAYQQQLRFSNWLLASGLLQPGDQVALPKHDFMDNLLPQHAALATSDVIYQVYTGAPGTYSYAALEDESGNPIKWVAAPIPMEAPFAALQADVPFWKFDSLRYQPVTDTFGWRLYRWQH